jgi:hypothetical protein
MTLSRASIALITTVLPWAASAAPITFPIDFLDAVAEGRYAAPTPERQEDAITPLGRLAPADFADGFGAPAGPDRPNARDLALALNDPALTKRDVRPMSNLAVAFSQLLASHDTALTPTNDEVVDTPVRLDDPVADRSGGTPVMVQRRSRHTGGSGPGDPREPINTVTPFFDASIVYGSHAGTQALLRENDGTGRLRTGPSLGLPLIDGRPTAGDARAAENLVLESLHGLYLAEHNRLADSIGTACSAAGRGCSGDEIFAAARRIVAGGQQKVFYEEFLPVFLGTDELGGLVPNQTLLDAPAQALVLNEFSAAAGRVGHSQVPAAVTAALPGGPVRSQQIETCLFSGTCLAGASLAELLYGAATLPAEPIDTLVTEGLRNGQIPGPGSPLLIDLEATNIVRGRDHGLADYATVRAALGFEPRPLSDLLPESVIGLYPGDSGIDLLVGLFAEHRSADSYLGETAAAIWGLQFEWLKVDPLFYTRLDPDDPLAALIGDVTFAGLVEANTGLSAAAFGDSPFLAPIAPVPLPPMLPAFALTLLGAYALGRRRT